MFGFIGFVILVVVVCAIAVRIAWFLVKNFVEFGLILLLIFAIFGAFMFDTPEIDDQKVDAYQEN